MHKKQDEFTKRQQEYQISKASLTWTPFASLPGPSLQFSSSQPISTTETRRGAHTVMVRLPLLDITQQTSYPFWEISWRGVGSRNWQTHRIGSSFRTHYLPELTSGRYELRVRGTGNSGSTSWAKHEFELRTQVAGER